MAESPYTNFKDYIFTLGGRMPFYHIIPVKVNGRVHEFGLWEMFLSKRNAGNFISGIVYCVDSSDRKSLCEARESLDELQERVDLKGIPLLVFANKQDIKGAMTPEEVEDALHLHNFKGRPYYVQGCSAMSGEGLTEGLEWFVKYRDTAKNRKYMEGPVKETLEDGKEVLKSGHSWLSSFFSRQTVKT
jgi:GTPase SAR1 family protein